MRVSLFLPSLQGGGAERVMVTLANEFAARGIDVDIVLVQRDGAYLSDVGSGVRIVDLAASRTLASLPRLTAYLRRERPAGLLSAMSHANAVAIAAHALARSRARLVVSEHSPLSARLASGPNLRDGSWLPPIMRRLYRHAHGIVAVSAGVAEDLSAHLGLSRQSISVVHNPVVSHELLRRASAPLHHPWFAPGSPPVVLGVGRLAAPKDFTTLLHAFAFVRARRRARLMILGEGTQRSELELLKRSLGIGEDVSLPGFVSNPAPYMKHAAVLAMSSIREGFGNVLVEAMAAGTPVVSTDCPSGPSEILEQGRWGRLVPVRAPETLARAILRTLDDPNPPNVSRRAMDFTVDSAADSYLNLLIPISGLPGTTPHSAKTDTRRKLRRCQ